MDSLLIIHHNDLDGRCAAAIMARWAKDVPSIHFHEVDYNTLNPLSEVQLGDTVAVVDFSLTPDVMATLRAKGHEVIWCDHHATAADYPYTDLRGYRDFSEKGLSGAECTWRFCFPKDPIPWAATLIGDYDSWRLTEAPLCFQFYEGLKLYPTTPGDPFWYAVLNETRIVQEVIDKGRTAIQYRDNYCQSIADGYGYETAIGGHKAFAMNLYRFGSKAYGQRFGQYPICIGYMHDGSKFIVSLYSETVDVSVIAKDLGGGGHKGASGFVCEELPFSPRSGP